MVNKNNIFILVIKIKIFVQLCKVMHANPGSNSFNSLLCEPCRPMHEQQKVTLDIGGHTKVTSLSA